MSNPFVDEIRMAQILKVRAEMYSMTNEMCRRVGLEREIGHEILATESRLAHQDDRPMDMAFVARAIKRVSERL